ncbi:MAG: DUF2066 domain-containing protein [Gammaproteobacteria bacterium]
MAELIHSRFWRAAVLAAGLALCFAAGPADAARVEGLYQAEAGFDGDRDAAFREALGVVLVRITGRRDVTGRPEVAPLLANAAAYAQQYSQPAPDRFWAAFDGAALERELGQLRQPIWGTERPSTLLWIAVDAGGGNRFVVASGDELEEEAALREALLAAARSRGLPMVFPLMDAEDRAHASFAEVWGGFEDSVLAVSARYGADAVLVGRLATADLERGRWTLFAADGVERWSGTIAESIDRLADLFAARFAVVSSGESRVVRLEVTGVDSIDDYGRISRFLGSLTAVESLGVETVEGDSITFRVSLRGEPETLDEAIRLGGLLRPDGLRPLSYQVAK